MNVRARSRQQRAFNIIHYFKRVNLNLLIYRRRSLAGIYKSECCEPRIRSVVHVHVRKAVICSAFVFHHSALIVSYFD